jgi:ribosomal subunit interface protein
MQLKLTARHENLSDAVRHYAEEKVSKLDRRLHDLTLVELVFSRETNPSIADGHAVEAIVHTKGPNIVARESAPTYEASIAAWWTSSVGRSSAIATSASSRRVAGRRRSGSSRKPPRADDLPGAQPSRPRAASVIVDAVPQGTRQT